jgi:hypothetical protein
MAQKSAEAGTMIQLSQKVNKSGNRQSRGRRRSFLRNGVIGCLALLAFIGLARWVLGQEVQSWEKIVSIDVTKLPSKSVQYQSTENKPQDKTEFAFRGNGNDWSLIAFKFPESVTLKVNGKFDGYDPYEVIKTDKYYPFKTLLPVTLEIKPGAQTPVEIQYSLGSWSTGTVQSKAQNPGFEIGDARNYADVAGNVKRSSENVVAFSWNASGVASGGSPSPSAAPTQSPASTSQSSWQTYLTEDEPVVGVFVLIFAVLLFAVFIYFGVPTIVDSIKRRKRSKRSAHRSQNHPSPLDSLPGGSGAPIRQEGTLSAQPVRGPNHMATYDNKSPTERIGLGQPHQARSVVNPAPRAELVPALASPAAAAVKADGNRLEQMIKDEVERLRIALDEKASRYEQEKLVANAKAELESKLIQTDHRLDTIRKELEEMVLDQAGLMEQARVKLTDQFSDADQKAAYAKQQLEDLLRQVLAQSQNVETQLGSRISRLQADLAQQTAADSFFNKVLGSVLGQNVELLQDGNFERLIGEKLNAFFATAVEHGESLQDVRVRAEGINSAIKDVAIQMDRLNPQASVGARRPMQQFEGFVRELSGLQTQMQSRRATIETIVHVSVSLHAGARQTFLDELGRGIRREIDKLNDPRKYFESEMDELITTDLISIVDLCDKTVAPPPGSRADLEAALKPLFQQAGLRQILPNQGEPFKTAEQDLIEMAQGGGQSLTVAQVITRGFYYTHHEKTTLLRKAGVTVYR